MTIRTRSAAVLVAAFLLTGCAPTPAPSPSSTPPASEEGHDHDELVPAPTSSPDLAEAEKFATDALRAYASRDLDYTAWFEQLQPYLHETAVEAYGTVEPSRIPPMEIQDGAEAASTSTDVYAVVYVPTSLGEYTIELRRAEPTDGWGVTRFQPPA